MNIFQKQRILQISAILIILLSIIIAIFSIKLAVFISILLLIVWFVFHAKWWKCPRCNKNLMRVDIRISYCSHCGKELE